ncbi:MAG: heme ABC exporter ATP-binding protein CcmA [Proteobacteria bacterium]|nr:heme ABC exporter ATP-binding protein CcmA [Pseudomonadota bacterium]
MPSRSLEIDNLHVWRGERHVLHGVRFTLASGQCMKLTGPNGAGKTSLLRTIAGLMLPEEGQVRWDGTDVRQDLRAFHARMTYVGHEPPLKADLTAYENLHYWIGSRRSLTLSMIEAALARVGVAAVAGRMVRTLSAGQRRRVALAGLMLSAVPLWLLDEPATNLDAEGQQLVATLIGEQLGRGGLVVAAVHHELRVGGPVTELALGS